MDAWRRKTRKCRDGLMVKHEGEREIYVKLLSVYITCDGSITSQRSVLICMSWPLRGSRSRTFTSTRPPVCLRPSITWQRKHQDVLKLFCDKHYTLPFMAILWLFQWQVSPRAFSSLWNRTTPTSTISLISLCDSSLSSFTKAVPMGLSLRRKPLWRATRQHWSAILAR